MEKEVKYGTKEYREAYNNKSIATYNKDTDTYETSIPLDEVKVTPRNNLDLGQVVRNGTSKLGKLIGTAVIEGASLHPILGLARAATDMGFAKSNADKALIGLSAYPVPKGIRNFEAGKLIGGKPFRVYDTEIGKIKKATGN